MLSDKEIKVKYRPIFWKTPEKYYAVNVLKLEGFSRSFCEKCKRPFWSTTSRKVCGDPSCNPEESFSFLGKTPAKRELSYIDVWKDFSQMFKKFNYTPVKRYPIVSRWNPTMEYTNASIAAFQPYVISGEINPPAKKLVIPQLCFRTTDIDNVGLTMSHNTVFSMIGQHQFVPQSEWSQNKAFEEIFTWLKKGLGLPNDEITFHEDSWAGGGNLGPCMEFFSRGLELGNQVYMMYQQTPKGVEELKLKVLDMGMGQERNAWFSQGKKTIYDSTFPTVMEKLKKISGLKVDEELLQRFIPHAGLLNIDEVESIDKAWLQVSKKVGTDVHELKRNILPLSALYSIAEHSRALLVLLNDGALPSNVGGAYNLRVILRRALSYLDQYSIKTTLQEICKWHADYLKPLWPELSENLEDVNKILEVEKSKYNSTKEKSRSIVTKLLEDEEKINTGKLLELYDSQGISPELIREEARNLHVKVDVPEDFYKRVSELHEKQVQVHQTHVEKELDLKNVPETEILYYDDYKLVDFKAKVEKILDNNVILNKTAFYPTSGGQIHDLGNLGGIEVINIYKQGPHVVHVLKEKPSFRQGAVVEGHIDLKRRIQLAKHHSSAHILNAAARKVLGKHINQAGAKKTVEKAHLDITHYQALAEKEIKEIERVANIIIEKDVPIISMILPRDKAEERYGMTIYQGGAVPGKKLRILDIKGIDVEACGGTHLKRTSEAGKIKIIKSSKVQDGIIRIEYKAGEAAESEVQAEGNLIGMSANILNVQKSQVPARAEELFEKWKKAKKGKLEDYDLTSRETENGSDQYLLERTAQILKTQPEHVPKTLERFLRELKEAGKK